MCSSFLSVTTSRQWQCLTVLALSACVGGVQYMCFFFFFFLFANICVCMSILVFAACRTCVQSLNSSVSVLYITWLSTACLCYVCEPLAQGTKIALPNPPGFQKLSPYLISPELSRGREAGNKVAERGGRGIAKRGKTTADGKGDDRRCKGIREAKSKTHEKVNKVNKVTKCSRRSSV